jgi:rhamnosyltransferase
MIIDQDRLPRICVLMAAYNGEQFIADQVATILNQRNVSVTLRVRDDGSTDATVAVIEAEARRDPRVALVDSGDLSTGSAARNFLHMLATVDLGESDYVALADQDDLWLSHKLYRAIGQIEKFAAGGYSADLIAFDDAGRKAPWLLRKHDAQRRFDHVFQGASAGCTYVLTRATVEKMRPWLRLLTFPVDHGVSHDWAIYAFVRNYNLGWVCDDIAPILYRQHTTNVYGSQRGIGAIVARVRLLRARWYRRHILWLAAQLDLSVSEQILIRRVTRLSLLDRFWLIAHAGQLRRRYYDVLMLRLAIAMGLF